MREEKKESIQDTLNKMLTEEVQPSSSSNQAKSTEQSSDKGSGTAALMQAPTFIKTKKK